MKRGRTEACDPVGACDLFIVDSQRPKDVFSGPVTPGSGKGRLPLVLVVEDEEKTRISVAEGLGLEGWNVFAAADGNQAVERLAAADYDLVILDWMMPGLDGYAVCRSLQGDAATRDIPVIFVSTLDAPDDEARGLALGAVDYVTRPLRPATCSRSCQLRSAARKSGMKSPRSASTTPTSVTSGKW